MINPYLFIYAKDGIHAYFFVYMDDIPLTGSRTSFLEKVMTYLKSKFAIKSLGRLSYFLEVEATWQEDGLLLTQSKYISDLLEKTQMAKSKLVSTNPKMKKKLPNTSIEPSYYRQVVGSLQY